MKRKLALNGNSWVLYVHKSFAKIMGVTDSKRKVLLTFKKQILYIQPTENDDNRENVKLLIKRGGGYGLAITLPFLELLKINPETDFVEISLDEKTLIIEKFKE